MTHNYIAEPSQYPTIMKGMDYTSKVQFNNRYKKSGKERAELYALKLAFETEQRNLYGSNWKTKLNQKYKTSLAA